MAATVQLLLLLAAALAAGAAADDAQDLLWSFGSCPPSGALPDLQAGVAAQLGANARVNSCGSSRPDRCALQVGTAACCPRSTEAFCTAEGFATSPACDDAVSGSLATIGDAAAGLNGASAFAVSAWINPSAPGISTIAGRFYGGDQFSLIMGLPRTTNTRTLQFAVTLASFSEYTVAGAPLPLNTWLHVAGVMAGDRIAVYINGQQAGGAELPAGSMLASSTLPLKFGSGPQWNQLSGQMDCLALYKRPLNASDVAAEHAKQQAAGCGCGQGDFPPPLCSATLARDQAFRPTSSAVGVVFAPSANAGDDTSCCQACRAQAGCTHFTHVPAGAVLSSSGAGASTGPRCMLFLNQSGDQMALVAQTGMAGWVSGTMPGASVPGTESLRQLQLVLPYQLGSRSGGACPQLSPRNRSSVTAEVQRWVQEAWLPKQLRSNTTIKLDSKRTEVCVQQQPYQPPAGAAASEAEAGDAGLGRRRLRGAERGVARKLPMFMVKEPTASFQSMLDWMGQHSYAMAAQSVINGASGASLRADLKVKSVLVQYIMNGKFDMRDAVTHLQLGPGGAGYATSSVTAGVEAFGAHRELVAELDAVDLSALGNDTFGELAMMWSSVTGVLVFAMANVAAEMPLGGWTDWRVPRFYTVYFNDAGRMECWVTRTVPLVLVAYSGGRMSRAAPGVVLPKAFTLSVDGAGPIGPAAPVVRDLFAGAECRRAIKAGGLPLFSEPCSHASYKTGASVAKGEAFEYEVNFIRNWRYAAGGACQAGATGMEPFKWIYVRMKSGARGWVQSGLLTSNTAYVGCCPGKPCTQTAG